jgi:hypothetical protein
MKLAGCCGAQSPESRFTPANTRAAANHGFFRKEDLLAAPGRSRHFGPSESAVRLDSGASGEIRRSPFPWQRNAECHSVVREPS